MDRFLGNIEAKADIKGRLFIPALFRKQLQAASEERLIMRKDTFQECLVLYPESVWNEELNEPNRACQNARWRVVVNGRVPPEHEQYCSSENGRE